MVKSVRKDGGLHHIPLIRGWLIDIKTDITEFYSINTKKDMKYIRIKLLKYKLKRVYIQLQEHFDYMDCGHTLLCSMSSRYYNLCKEFNTIADRLSKIDPDAIKHRYKLN